ncbi:MAG TPA: hypothetical protein VJL29_10120 [Thermoguttaceae bacterium]|nr:hypothetical protein [Thermoguttaceae bacterium]
MIEQERDKLRAVAWSEILPWLNLFRTFRIAIRIRPLLLGAAAVLLTTLGWAFFDWAASYWSRSVNVNPPSIQQSNDAADTSVAERQAKKDRAARQKLNLQTGGSWSQLTGLVPNRPFYCPAKSKSITAKTLWSHTGGRFTAALSPRAGFGDVLLAVLSGVWAVFVWAWFGGAITRGAAMELAADERIGNAELLDFVKRHWRAYFAAPLFPLLGVLLATVGIFVVGLLLNTGLTAWIAAILWPLLLVGGLMMAVLLLGLGFGWPLMWPTISTEGTDSFDALSRTYAYVFQKPLQYLFYVVVAGLFGVLGWLLVSNFAAAVITLTDWAASWACGSERLGKILGRDSSLGLGSGAAALIYIWRDCVKLIAVGFLYSYFWTAASAIYLLLRRGVDATEMDEIYVEDERAGEVYGLPKIETDEQGAPIVAPDGETQTPDKPTDA